MCLKSVVIFVPYWPILQLEEAICLGIISNLIWPLWRFMNDSSILQGFWAGIRTGSRIVGGVVSIRILLFAKLAEGQSAEKDLSLCCNDQTQASKLLCVGLILQSISRTTLLQYFLLKQGRFYMALCGVPSYHENIGIATNPCFACKLLDLFRRASIS